MAHQVLPQRGTRGEQGLRVCLSLPRPGRCRAGDSAGPAHTRGRDAGSLLHQPQGSVSRPELQHDFASRTGWGYPKFDERQILATRVRRGGDRFTIRCDVVVINGFRTEEATPSATIPPLRPAQAPRQPPLEREGRRRRVRGRRRDVRRAPVRARGPVVGPQRGSPGLGVGERRRGRCRCLRVDGVDPPAFRALLRYAYTDSLQEMDRDEEDAVLRNCKDKLCRLIDVGTVQITLE